MPDGDGGLREENGRDGDRNLSVQGGAVSSLVLKLVYN